jgi:hypothetical protein
MQARHLHNSMELARRARKGNAADLVNPGDMCLQAVRPALGSSAWRWRPTWEATATLLNYPGWDSVSARGPAFYPRWLDGVDTLDGSWRRLGGT